MMHAPSTLLRSLLVFAVFGLAACTRPLEPKKETSAAKAEEVRAGGSAPAAAAASGAPPAGGDFFGARLILVDTQGRPLECRGMAKTEGRVLVQRTADKQPFVVELARLSPESRAAVAAYPDTRADELAAFVDERDYAAAKRSVKVELISATWCGWCTKAKEYFAKEKIPYQVFDHESQGGKRRQEEWGSTSLPTVKIGGEVIRGFEEERYREALLSEYRKSLGGAGGA